MHRPEKSILIFAILLIITACVPTAKIPTPTATKERLLEFAYLSSPDPVTTPASLYYYDGRTSILLMEHVREYSWSPDGSMIAAVEVFGQSYSEKAISLFNMETRQSTSLVSGDSPTWSPDGTQIAYQDTNSDPVTRAALYIVTIQPSNPTRKVVDLELFASNPAWSPDGKWIAYQDYTEGEWNLFLLNATTLQSTKISSPQMDNNHTLAWSPDSTKLLFGASGNSNEEIMVADVSSGRIDRLTDNGVLDVEGSWSPDGEKILFSSFRVEDKSHIFLMNSDGSNVTQLSDTVGGSPAWSLEGTLILFNKDGGSIYQINADGSGEMPVPSVEPQGYHPQWRPR